MLSQPLWTALPTSLAHLLDRLSQVVEYPVIDVGRARCRMGLVSDRAPDPHDWQLWRSGVFLARYDDAWQSWPVYLRRCPACGSVEVRRDGESRVIASVMPAKRLARKRTPGASDVLLGWYQGT